MRRRKRKNGPGGTRFRSPSGTPAFAWLPVESIVRDRRQEYCETINAPNNAVSSTAFLEFMLSAIKASRMEAVNVSDGMSDPPKDKAAERWKQIEQFLERHEVIQNADARQLRGISAATASRVLIEQRFGRWSVLEADIAPSDWKAYISLLRIISRRVRGRLKKHSSVVSAQSAN